MSIGADPEWFIGTKPERWFERIACRQLEAIRIATNVTKLIIPEWIETQPMDKIPVKVIESAQEISSDIGPGMREHMSVLAKACAASRQRTLGSYHHVAEAARAVAHTVIARSDDAAIAAAAEALAKTEEHILYRHAVEADHGQTPEVRRRMFARVLEALV